MLGITNDKMMTENTALHKLANMVVATCNSTPADFGLLKGKLGAAVFLLHYARYSKNDRYILYANELLEFIQDNLINYYSKKINPYVIDAGIVLNYIVSEKFDDNNLDDLLNDVDYLLFSRIDNKNILYLANQELIFIGKYFLIRIDATPTSVIHKLHIDALNRIVEIIKIHLKSITICNPAIVKFLYCASKVLTEKSIVPLLMKQLNYYPNKTEWSRSVIPNWHTTFFNPKDNKLLKDIIIKEIVENSSKYLNINRSDLLSDGTSGFITWINLLSDDLQEEKYIEMKNSAVKKIVSNIDCCKITTDISIYFGCSGIGLTLLSCLDNKCNKWIQLL